MADPNPDSQLKTRCGHAGCDCKVEADQFFCSPYCEKASQTQAGGVLLGGTHSQGKCQCGHPDCT